MRVELASQQLGLGLSLRAADVLKLALRSLEEYRREAAFWRALAAPERGRRALPSRSTRPRAISPSCSRAKRPATAAGSCCTRSSR